MLRLIFRSTAVSGLRNCGNVNRTNFVRGISVSALRLDK